jgi:ankyrin repeat protein
MTTIFHWRAFKAASLAVACAIFVAGCASTKLPDAAQVQHGQAPIATTNAHQFDSEWFAAARAGRVDILGALLDAHYPIDATTSQGYTALILAAYDAQPATVDFLLRRHANACVGDHNGNTALMGALFKGEPDIARTLMSTNCAIDQANYSGETALAFAALFGRLDMMPLLTARGANPNHVDARGGTLLQIAEEQGNQSAVLALRKVGATY